MTHRILDRVQETTISNGPGPLTLAGPVSKMLGFSAAGLSDGDTFWGLIEHATAAEWEIALCTFASAGAGSITRAAPLKSSTGSAVSFSSGTKVISLIAPASKTPVVDADGNYTFQGNIVATGVREVVAAPTISAGVLTLDLSTASIFNVALDADITSIVITNPPAAGYGGSFSIRFTADGTLRAITMPGSVVPTNGTYAPSSTNAKRDRLAFFSSDGGTTWEMIIVAQNF
ncbi:MAG: hypothetical protein K9G48_08615 [Reyranella sp.]|nr:hypothetical protein [Reyranella sp.]